MTNKRFNARVASVRCSQGCMSSRRSDRIKPCRSGSSHDWHTVHDTEMFFSHWYGPCNFPLCRRSTGAARKGRCLPPSRHERSCFCLPARTLNRVLNKSNGTVYGAGFDFRYSGARHHPRELFGQRVADVDNWVREYSVSSSVAIDTSC